MGGKGWREGVFSSFQRKLESSAFNILQGTGSQLSLG
jgi:hypothetical protein